MKKMMAICGVFVIALAFAGIAAADCGGCDKTASNDGAAALSDNDGAGCDKRRRPQATTAPVATRPP